MKINRNNPNTTDRHSSPFAPNPQTQLFPFLPDALAARVAAWACLLLRSLAASPTPTNPTHPTLLLSPAHLLASLDPTTAWFGEWSLRLPSHQLAHTLRRTGLLHDLTARAAPAPAPTTQDGGLNHHQRLLRLASLSALVHALRAWPSTAFATAADNHPLLAPLVAPDAPLWGGAAWSLDPARLPAAAADVTVATAGGGGNQGVLALDVKGAEGGGEGKEEEEGGQGELCGRVLGLFTDSFLLLAAVDGVEAAAEGEALACGEAAAAGLLHLAGGLGGRDPRVLVRVRARLYCVRVFWGG